jgi:CRISPR-associated endonuclease Csn1
VNNALSLHTKKDHLGNEILNKDGKTIGVDFISTGNNHHVAIYRDEKGNLKDEVVSFYDAVVRRNLGLPVINKRHENGWEFLFTLKQNEYFIFPTDIFNPNEIDLLNPENYNLISPNMFRVQKLGELGSSGFWFRHHLETTLENSKPLKSITYIDIYSHKALENIVKVRINHLGQIVHLGEY